VTTQPNQWWQTGVIYQVYPRSFMDSNGDGVGDLAGITDKLDYLSWLGVDALWLSPIYPSPMADFGYDVSDYTGVDPLFGTLADVDRLLAEAHGRGLKLILDFVPNHTSDEHPWFVESRGSRDNPKRDWYIWRDPAPDGGPPNNWLGMFGGNAWVYDEPTGQYYLHLFDRKQPDLNWRNPEVRAAMYDALRFWLDRGVDGFRVDVIWLLIKDALFRDNPDNPDWRPGDPPGDRQVKLYVEDRPEVHEIVREMRGVLDGYGERVLIGEIYLPLPRLVTYYGADGRLDECDLPFNFSLVLASWNAQAIRRTIDDYEAALPAGAWPNWVLGNHDQSRIASRVGPAQARVAQMLLLTLRGTPTAYYGDELGMPDVLVPHELAHDPQELLSPGHGRDPERTPMQWDGGPNAGFSTGTPWLPVAEDYRTVNVAVEWDEPRSMLALVRRLLELRRAIPALTVGTVRTLDAGHDDALAYLREHDGQRVLVALNLGAAPHTLDLGHIAASGTALIATGLDREGSVDLARLELRANAGMVVRIM